MAPPRGFEADVQSLVSSFVSQHGATASFEGFKSVWCARTVASALRVGGRRPRVDGVPCALAGAATASR